MIGLFAGSLANYLQNNMIKKISGASIMLFAFYLMYLAVKVIRQG
jgi:hypothetical protein